MQTLGRRSEWRTQVHEQAGWTHLPPSDSEPQAYLLYCTLVCLWFAIANPHFDLCALHVKAIVIDICCGTRGFKLRDPICLHPDHPTTSLISQSTLWSVMINQLSLWTLVEECWPSKGHHAPHDGMAHSDSKPNSLVWWLKESKYSPSCTLWCNRLCSTQYY